MKFIVTLILIIWSFLAFPCLHIEGDFIVNENQTHLNQKIDFGKDYAFMQDHFILHLKFISPDHKAIKLEARTDKRSTKELIKTPIKYLEIKKNTEQEVILFNDDNNLIKFKFKAITT